MTIPADVATHGSNSPEAFTRCSSCGRVAPAAGVVCRYCWRPLKHEVLDRPSALVLMQSEQSSVARDRRLRRIRFVQVALAAVLIGFISQRIWFSGPQVLPSPQSTSAHVVAAAEVPASWPHVGGDRGLTRMTTAAAAIDGRVVWRVALGSPLTTPIVAGDGALYVGVANAALVALSSVDGRELWRSPVPGQLDAAPAYADGRLYVGMRDGTIAALDAVTGRVIWNAGEGPTFVTSPVVDGGVVYASALGDVRAFDADTGRLLWQKRDDELASSSVSPALSATELVVGTTGRVVVFDRSTGAQANFFGLRNPAHVVVHDGQVIVAGQTRVVAFGLDQRRPWWDPLRTAWGQLWILGMAPVPPDQPNHWIQRGERFTYAPAIAGDVVVIATQSGKVRGLDLRTGQERWKIEAGRLVSAPVTTSTGVLLITPSTLVIVDSATGTERARRVLDGEQVGGVTVTTGGTYLASRGDGVVALR